MIISTDKKFIFIHGIKTGGTSLRDLLKCHRRRNEPSALYKVLRKLPITRKYKMQWPLYNSFKHPHTSAAYIKHIMPRQLWEEMWTFGVVRDPVEWMLSSYKHWCRYPNRQIEIESIVKAPIRTFEDFILFRADQYTPLQALQFIDLEGAMITQTIGSFECINEFSNFVTRRLEVVGNIPHLNHAPAEQKVIKVSAKNRTLIESICRLDYQIFDLEKPDRSDGTISVKIPVEVQLELKEIFSIAGGLAFDPWRIYK